MISLIVAADEKLGIGAGNKLLCRIKDDMKHFVEKTRGKKVIMGSKTFESLGNKPLKNRQNIVLTKSPMALTIEHFDLLDGENPVIFEDFELVKYMVEESSPEEEFVVIGGGKVYELFLPLAQRIYLTSIHNVFIEADTFFPSFGKGWKTVEQKSFPQNADNEYPFTISTLERSA